MPRAPEIVRKTTFEEKLINFDFSNEMVTGETISSAAVTANPALGSPELTKIGAETISGQKVQVKIGEGVAGKLYDLICRITTSSQKLEGVGTVFVEDET